MNIITAYNRRLIKIGSYIITNGNGNTTLYEKDSYLKGRIVAIGGTYFIVSGHFYNKTTKLDPIDEWGINYSNTIAYIEFINKTKKISQYAFWLMQNKL
jgi:hypothetical protein